MRDEITRKNKLKKSKTKQIAIKNND